MKLLLTILLLPFFTIKQCNSDTLNSTIEYSIFTRGTYKKILIAQQKMYLSKEREGRGEEIEVLKEDWSKIIVLIEKIDLDKIQGLKGDSSNRVSDRSFHAHFLINKNGKTYKTNEFDHGNPPKEIAELVNLISKYL
ncbi:MAG: hypothetical protein ACOVQ2_05755 [Flavobacterium sp.]